MICGAIKTFTNAGNLNIRITQALITQALITQAPA